MKIKIYYPETDRYKRIISPIIKPHGYVELPEFDAEKCWDLCNWDCWAERKPDNVHTDIERCNHGLIVYNPEAKEYWLALSHGWMHGNVYEISEYVYYHWKEDFWL